MIGLFLSAVTLGLLVLAVDLVGSAVQRRMADEPVARAPQERVLSVDVVRATPGTETPVLESFGSVQSRRTLELRAAVGGRITELADGFENGGEVTEGQILVQLDSADARAEVERARTAVAEMLTRDFEDCRLYSDTELDERSWFFRFATRAARLASPAL